MKLWCIECERPYESRQPDGEDVGLQCPRCGNLADRRPWVVEWSTHFNGQTTKHAKPHATYTAAKEHSDGLLGYGWSPLVRPMTDEEQRAYVTDAGT